MSTKEQRKRLRAYCDEHEKRFQEWVEAGYPRRPNILPPIPADLVAMQCGAMTKRDRTPCKRKDIYLNGRCKFHGGMSTGPKTEEGKKKSSQNARKDGKTGGNAIRN